MEVAPDCNVLQSIATSHTLHVCQVNLVHWPSSGKQHRKIKRVLGLSHGAMALYASGALILSPWVGSPYLLVPSHSPSTPVPPPSFTSQASSPLFFATFLSFPLAYPPPTYCCSSLKPSSSSSSQS